MISFSTVTAIRGFTPVSRRTSRVVVIMLLCAWIQNFTAVSVDDSDDTSKRSR